jgi:endonuclease III
MVAPNRGKPMDKQEICRKIASLLKKSYSAGASRRDLPVLETLLYATCLENTPPEQADQVYARLLNTFHDLNEIRVSSISELEKVFHDMEDPAWRALRVKSSLQYVFETSYSFDFESLRRKTAELAVKQLAKIPSLSYFVRGFVLQHCLGSHALPIDDKMLAALQWIGLADSGMTAEQAGDGLRGFVRKADGPLFCHLLHALAADPRWARVFSRAPEGAAAAADPIQRLQLLLAGKAFPKSRPEAAKSSRAKAPTRNAHSGNGKRTVDPKKKGKPAAAQDGRAKRAAQRNTPRDSKRRR